MADHIWAVHAHKGASDGQESGFWFTIMKPLYQNGPEGEL